jgi:lysophospholipid acyltransferase (LPLAT)-like uncharacterized protein
VKAARAVLGLVVGLVARLWLRTLRLELEVHPSLGETGDRPWVLAFLHGKQWPLLAWKRRRPTVVMVSHSKDGEIQSRALSMLGFTIVRGSSSNGGARGLAAVVRRLRTGDHDAAFAVDGPRGPYGVPKPGVFLAARRANALIVPMGSAIANPQVFGRAWDRFALAWPFARVTVVLGPPLELGGDGEATPDVRSARMQELAASIASANEAAEGILAVSRSNMLRFSRHLPVASHPKGEVDALRRARSRIV